MMQQNTFKNTEMGMIHENWNILELGELGDFRNGVNFNKNDFGKGLPIINVKNLFRGHYATIDDLSEIKEGTIKNTESYKLQKGDILFARSSVKHSGTGQVAMVRNLPSNTTLFSGFIIRFRNHSYDKLDNEYLNYLLRSEIYRAYLRRIATGTTISNLSQNALFKIPIILPPLREQLSIASILRSLDDKIELNRQINQTLESMAQTIFKSWFVDFDPVKAKIAALEVGEDSEGVTCATMRAISGKANDELDQMQVGQPENYAQLKTTAELFPSAMQDSELGEVPEGWALKPLYETAEYVNGSAFKAKYFSEKGSGLPIIKIAELKQGISSGTKYTTEDVKEKYFIDNDDVLYSWSGSPETSLEVFKWFGGKGYLNQHIFKLNFENSQQKYFTYFLLQHMKPVLIRTAQQKQTTGLGHVTVADMKRMLVAYPYNKTLTRFSEVVGSIYEQNSILQREISMLVSLRDTLLPKLLSGELSIDAVELAEAET